MFMAVPLCHITFFCKCVKMCVAWIMCSGENANHAIITPNVNNLNKFMQLM